MRTILISAYACEPLKGSEQGVGWNWVLQLAKHNYLHVITRANNQEVIEAHLPSDIGKNITFHYYDTNSFIKGFKNKAKGLYFYYFFWQLGICSIVEKLIKKNMFDYSMHITMGSIWMPTFLPFFKIPFIWGPIGGGEGIPKSFLSSLPFRHYFIQSLRYILKFLIYLNPLIIYTIYKSSSIIVRTKNTLNFIPKVFRYKTKVFLETSIEDSIFDYKLIKTSKSKSTRLIITGRLVPFKNVITAIRSLQFIPSSYIFDLTIIGSGSEKSKIEKEVKSLQLSEKVHFIEETTREKVLEEI